MEKETNFFMQIVIIIPCHNEAKRLQVQCFEDFVNAHSDCKFLFVNDGSTDNTLCVITDLIKKHENLLLLNFEKNKGKAEAIRLGVLYVTENLPCDYIGFWDADLATPLDEIFNFVRQIEKCDYEMITGLRLLRLGTEIRRKTYRHYLGRVFATFASNVLDLPVYDTQCGAKLYKSEIVECLFEEEFVTRWLFDVEILARYIRYFGKEKAIKKIYEYPIKKWEDVGGSQLKIVDFLRVPYELLKIWNRYLKKW